MNHPATIFNRLSIIPRGLILMVMTLFLIAGSSLAQGDAESKRAAAQKLFNQGMELRGEGSKESLQTALSKFEEAQPIFHSLSDTPNEALVLLAIGRTYGDLGEYQKFLDYSSKALMLYRAAGDRKSEAITLNNIATVHYMLGDRRLAIDYFEQALTISRAENDQRNEALTLDNIGSVYEKLGERQKALDYHLQALRLYRVVRDRGGEANALNNVGLIYADRGEEQKALDYYAQALPIHREEHDRDAEAVTLFNIAATYSRLGETQKALDNFTEALSLFRIVGDRKYEASTLNDIAKVYLEVGKSKRALEYLTEALSLKQAIGDRAGEADVLNNIGAIYDELSDHQKALEYYAQALPIRRAVEDRQGEATTLGNIGMTYRDLNDTQKSLDYLFRSLPLYQDVGDRQGEAVTLDNIGDSYEALGDRQKALDYYGRSLSILRAIGDRGIEAGVLGNVALLERDAGNLNAARANVEAAIAIIESLRTKIINRELRSSYFAKAEGYYEFYIDLLMKLHQQNPKAAHDGEALQVSEQFRARSLLDTLAEAGADVRQGVDAALVERERNLQQRLNATAQNQMKLLSGAHTKEQADALAKELEALTLEYQQVETQIRQKSPRYAALTQPQTITLKEIQTQVLDANTLLLEYSLGKERSYVWAVTPVSMTSYELPQSSEIEIVARRFYDHLNARNKRVPGETKEQWNARVRQADKETPEAAADLSRIVLTPVATELGKKRLVIVADGVLQYIPFASLPVPSDRTSSSNLSSDNYQPLIAEHEIVSLPSASALSVLRREVLGRRPAPKTVVVLADPVFAKSDSRVKRMADKTGGKETQADKDAGTSESVREIQLLEAAQNTGVAGDGMYVPRLPGTRQEAEEIIAMVAPSERKLALDFAASRETAASNELSQYRYVHFSTHGFLNSVHPELSGLVFSLVNENGEAQDGFLRAHEVFNLKLNADLVVLSACQTGIGKEVKGEGLVSLTRGFMYAGAPRVVVSLWSVSETGTTELMVRFYREMLKEGKPPAAALRAAQLSLMKEKRWSSPFFWAPFVLQGEWR